MDGIDWTQCSWLYYDPDTDRDKLMEREVTHLSYGRTWWMKCVNQSSSGLLVSNGSIPIITIYVQVMQCHPEERRTTYSWHSFEWIGVRECIDMPWEEFYTSSIEHKKSFVSSHFHDRRWYGQSNHCTTVADLHHARRHATGSNCISLQDHHQQRILITRGRSTVILQYAFCRPPIHATHQHLYISLRDI